MTRRPLLVASAATAALALCAASGTAAAATTSTKAAGRGTSTLSLLDLKVGGHTLSLADIALLSDTIASPRVSQVAVTPLVVDGTAYGRQVVDQTTSPKSVGAISGPSAIAPFATLTSPAINLVATGGPSNQAGTSSLGALKVLGLPVNLGGSLQAASAVSGLTGASGLKTVTLKNLALPSIADILGALGLDLSALPVGTLDELVSSLELVNGAIGSAEGAVDTAQSALNTATAALTSRTASLTSAQSGLTTAQATLTSATTALNGILGPLSLSIAQFEALSALAQQALDPTNSLGLLSAYQSYTSAQSAVTAATALVATAQGLVNSAQALVTTLTSTLTGALSTLLNAIMGVLDGTPLVSLQSLEVTTRAVASSASKGGQHAEVVGGVVKGLNVLGVDVLDSALGSSTLDLEGALTSKLAEVNGLISDVTGTLSEVLSTVPSLPALDIPAPVIGLLTKSASTSISGGFGRASTAVHALSISLPAITLPTAVAVPGAAALPGLDGVTQVAGKLTSAPLSMDMLTLHDQAAFRPALAGSTPGTGTTGTPGDHLAGTGLPAGVAVMALFSAAAALVLRRRTLATV
ncbi:MAG TPA: hypothetical protein VMZ11_07740 [Mycobacteriales bacterium]|nr:hypothetical protein [Mycobacteriales bacterium]